MAVRPTVMTSSGVTLDARLHDWGHELLMLVAKATPRGYLKYLGLRASSWCRLTSR